MVGAGAAVQDALSGDAGGRAAGNYLQEHEDGGMVHALSDSDAVYALSLPFYSSRHPKASHGWGISVIWEIPVNKA